MTTDSERRCPICDAVLVKPRTESREHFAKRRTCSRICGQQLRRHGKASIPETNTPPARRVDQAAKPTPVVVMDAMKRAKAIARRDKLARRLEAKFGPPRLASDSSFRPDP